jgi:hypothetical protein
MKPNPTLLFADASTASMSFPQKPKLLLPSEETFVTRSFPIVWIPARQFRTSTSLTSTPRPPAIPMSLSLISP